MTFKELIAGLKNNTIEYIEFDEIEILNSSEITLVQLSEFQNALASNISVSGINYYRQDKYEYHYENGLIKVEVNKNDDGEIIEISVLTALFEALKKNSSVKALDLTRCNLNNEGTIIISESLKFNKSIQELNLTSNKIGDEGAIALANALKINHSLCEITLDNNHINKAGLKAISNALEVNFSIKVLSLFDNKITDEDVNSIVEIFEKNYSLESLKIFSNYVSVKELTHVNNRLSENVIKTVLKALEINTSIIYGLFNVTGDFQKNFPHWTITYANKIYDRNKTIAKWLNNEYNMGFFKAVLPLIDDKVSLFKAHNEPILKKAIQFISLLERHLDNSTFLKTLIKAGYTPLHLPYIKGIYKVCQKSNETHDKRHFSNFPDEILEIFWSYIQPSDILPLKKPELANVVLAGSLNDDFQSEFAI